MYIVWFPVTDSTVKLISQMFSSVEVEALGGPFHKLNANLVYPNAVFGIIVLLEPKTVSKFHPSSCWLEKLKIVEVVLLLYSIHFV